ncbi:MAG TPA: cytochrome c [Rhodocyclaceae bacterium]|nr:cytochrome c [Rhodocyclaceae bacterium]
MNMKIRMAAAAVFFPAMLSSGMGSVCAAPSAYEDSIRYRRAAMVMIKHHYEKALTAVKATPVDRALLEKSAVYLELLAKQVGEGYEPGSHGGETHAKPEIWENRAKFDKLAESFQAEAVKFRQMAKTLDAKTGRQALDNLSKPCKSCHDEYKKRST